MSKLIRSVQYCGATRKLHSQTTRDGEALAADKDDRGNLLNLQYGLSDFVEHQVLTVQEIPEATPAGLLPCPIDVVVERDLADKFQPGDRVVVVGACIMERKGRRVLSNVHIIANNVKRKATGFPRSFIFRSERQMMVDFGRSTNAIEVLVRSIAPSLNGNRQVKQAILYMLVGGRDLELVSGMRRRGEIHVLLIGDTAVGKSQMIRYVRNVAGNAVMATGNLASAEGLTVYETTQESDVKSLQAGAMVFADRGVICIDEFDKVSSKAVDSMTEPMDRGTITFSKPGISATVNARCAVLACASSVYGQYEITKTLSQNLGLTDAFLSRFDLVFLIRDKNTEDDDIDLANFILRVHISAETSCGDIEVNQDDTMHQRLPRVNISDYAPGLADSKILPLSFVKAYVSYAKRLKPRLSEAAAEYINNRWVELRQLDKDKAAEEKMVSVSARTLHSMIRIAEAHAKCRLSLTVQEADAAAAFEILHFASFTKMPSRITKPQVRKEAAKTREAQRMISMIETGESSQLLEQKTRRKAKRSRSQPPVAPRKAARRSSTGSTPHAPQLAEDKYKSFMKIVRCLFDGANVDYVTEQTFRAKVGTYDFDDSEITAGLTMMSNSNFLMVADGLVCLI